MYSKTLTFAALVVASTACVSEPTSKTGGPAIELAADAPRREIAQNGLVKLTGLARERKHYLKMGFHTPDEVASASLGDALPIYRIALSSLQGYQRGADLNAVMVDTDSAFYPTVVDGSAVSGIMVGKQRDGRWAVTSFGRPTWAHAAQQARERITASRGVAPSALAFVEVETPQVVLLVRHVEDGATLLTSVVDLPKAKLRAGEPLTAADAIERLQAMVN